MRNAAFDQNLRRASWRYKARTIALPVLLVASGWVLFARFFMTRSGAARTLDLGHAPLRQSIARITNVALQPGNRENADPLSLMTLRLPGFSAPVTVFHADTTLHEGDRVSLAYRVGKSGRVYVEHMERLPAANRKQQGDLSR